MLVPKAPSTLFPGVDQYYTPFLSPARDHVFSKRDLQEILPERNDGVPLVPQLLTKYPEDFIWAAGELSAMGYPEVNLNLGCPSGTVVAKGRGSGMLKDLEALERFWTKFFLHFRLSIFLSKPGWESRTRVNFPDSWRYTTSIPFGELTVHPRVQQDFYKGPIRWQSFAYAVAHSGNPLCYNGDLRTPADCRRMEQALPSLPAAMLGRGLVANPGLITGLHNGVLLTAHTLQEFHDALYGGYCSQYQNREHAVMRMKELWSYMIRLFPHSEKIWKRLRKTGNASQYETVVQVLFQEYQLGPEATG